MPFRLRRDTRKWFRDIESEFQLDFDMYYICLIAGLSTCEKTHVPTADTTELVDYYPGEYREKGRLIISLFLSRELKSQGINFSEREALHGEISGLLDSMSPSCLSDMGMKEMNRYSYGGFKILTEWFTKRPRSLEDFLPLYWRYLKQSEEA